MSDGVRIIKPGKLPEDQMIAGKCDRCDCEFEAPKRLWDLKHAYRGDESWWEIECPTPECGKTVCNYSA